MFVHRAGFLLSVKKCLFVCLFVLPRNSVEVQQIQISPLIMADENNSFQVQFELLHTQIVVTTIKAKTDMQERSKLAEQTNLNRYFLKLWSHSV